MAVCAGDEKEVIENASRLLVGLLQQIVEWNSQREEGNSFSNYLAEFENS